MFTEHGWEADPPLQTLLRKPRPTSKELVVAWEKRSYLWEGEEEWMEVVDEVRRAYREKKSREDGER
tara:strand:- start:366 stop:566 length:201 start_codon:yes stop_codon:yes gene_type:complete